MAEIDVAKKALDAVISKSRVHLYKPIQIAEILYMSRTKKGINLLRKESYRIQSRKWRDDICKELLGRISTSSIKYQDDLFNAIPPSVLVVLGKSNKETNGAVEAYIYKQFVDKHSQLAVALSYVNGHTKKDFSVKEFIDLFWDEPGLKRSLDKIYEIIVYSLFSVLVDIMNLQVEISITEDKKSLLDEFADFAKKIMCLEHSRCSYVQDAKVYRVGVTNAADRGIDMYSNWGPAIQIKHLTLDVELAENIVDSVSSDRIVIVCKDAEEAVIVSLLTQIGWKSRIQSVVTENNLIEWYEKALRGKYSTMIGDKLLKIMRSEIQKEFPSVSGFPQVLNDRHYENIHNEYWGL